MRKLLFLVGGVVLVESVFFSALAPLLPRYAHELHLSKLGAGILVGSYAAGSVFGTLPAGWIASRFGARVTALSGLALLSVLSSAFAFAHSIWWLDLTRAGQGVGASLAWTGSLAWLVNEAPRERRGELIGLALAGASGGALLGPAVGAIATIVGVRPTFVAISALGGVLAIWGAIVVPSPGRRERQLLRALFPALRRPGIRAGLWLLTLPSLLFGVLGVLGPLRLSHVGFAGSAIGAVFLLSAGLEAVVSVFGGRWADRMGHEVPLRASLVGSMVACAILPLGNNEWSLALLIVAAATASGAFFAPAMALLADQAERAGLEQTLGFTLLNAAWAPGNFIGSSGGGALAAATNNATPFLVVAVLCLLTLPILRRLLRLESLREPASA